MIAIDTNILVYAHRAEYPQQIAAQRALADLAGRSWAIPWPCIHEFLAVVTRRNHLMPPTPVQEAISQVSHLLASPTLHLLQETEQHWVVFKQLVRESASAGVMIHDAKIAAICIQHGVREFWSADRDFSRFPQLKTVNPLI